MGWAQGGLEPALWKLVHTRPEGTVHQNTLRQADLESRFPGLLQAVLAKAVAAEATDTAG